MAIVDLVLHDLHDVAQWARLGGYLVSLRGEVHQPDAALSETWSDSGEILGAQDGHDVFGCELRCEVVEVVVDDGDPFGHQLLRRLRDRSGRRVFERATERHLAIVHVARKTVDELALKATEALTLFS